MATVKKSVSYSPKENNLTLSEEEKNKIGLDFIQIYKNKDFRLFCSYLTIPTRKNKEIKFEFDSWHQGQKDFESNRSGMDIVLKARQVGFTTLEEARDLFYALTNTNVQVGVVGHDTKIIKGMNKKILEMFRDLQDLKKATGFNFICPDLISSNTEHIIFDNKSAIYFRSAGKTEDRASMGFRGLTISRLHLSEFAYYCEPQAFMGSVIPSLTEKPEIVIESTPNGMDNEFYSLCQRAMADIGKPFAQSPYKFHFISWLSHNEYKAPINEMDNFAPMNEWEDLLIDKHVTKEQIKFWRNMVAKVNNDIEQVLRDYPIDPICCFRNSNNQSFFNSQGEQNATKAMKQPSSIGSIGDVRYDRFDFEDDYPLDPANPKAHPNKQYQYLIACDPALGSGQDFTVIYVFTIDARPQMVAHFKSNQIEQYEAADFLNELGRYFNNASICVETNKGRELASMLIQRYNYPNLWKMEKYSDEIIFKIRTGINMGSVSRALCLAQFKQALQTGQISVIDPDLNSEIKTFQRRPDGKPVAIEGKHDDHVMAAAIAFYAISQIQFESKPSTDFSYIGNGARQRWN